MAQQAHGRAADKTLCDLCDNVVETLMSKCVECNVHMCRPCTKNHSRLKLTKDHTVIADQLGPLPTSRDKSICPSHLGEDVRYYCYTCNKLICSLCITSNHDNHKCSPMKTASSEMADKLSQTLTKFKDNNIAELSSKINKIEKLEVENDKSGKLAMKNIKSRIQELVSEINKIGDKLIEESEKSRKQNTKHLTQIRESLVKELSEMEDLYKEYNNVLTSGSDIDKIIASNEADARLNNFNFNDKEVKIHLIGFIPGITDPASLQKSFGFNDKKEVNVFDSVQTDVKEYQPGYVDVTTNIDKTEDKVLKSDHHSTTKQQPAGPAVSTNIDVKVISTFKHKSTTVFSICPVTDNTVLIHCKGEYNNDIVNREGQVQRTVKLEFVVCDFVISSDGTIAIDAYSTDIYKLTMDGHQTGVIRTAPLEPVCLCMSSDGNILGTLCDKVSYEVNDDSRRCVARMTITGQTVDTYENNNGKRLFTVPSGISENINGDICVVNRTSGTSGHLVILDDKGRLKVTYTGGPMDEQFDPKRVKCDKSGHVIVTDYNNMKVHMLSSNGQLVQYLMTGKDLQYKPFSLAIDKQGFLWVGCDDGQVYKIKYIN